MNCRSLLHVLMLLAVPGLTAAQDARPESTSTSASELALVPKPTTVTANEGTFAFGPRVIVLPAHDALLPHAKVLAHELTALTGATAPSGESSPTIQLHLTGEGTSPANAESYTLTVKPDAINIYGATPAAVARGTATLVQAVRSSEQPGGAIPCCEISDAPVAAYRSLSIDIARQPHSIAVLEDAIRMAWLYKVRYIQLHLTDDQHFTFPFGPIVDGLEGNHSYTRLELRALVQYADSYGVVLIPEIDLPGHTRRLIESGYLEGATGHRDVASETHTYAIAALLDDVMNVFESSPYLHIGGDESGAGDQLVPFLARMNQHIRSRDRRMIVWEGFHGAPVEQIPATGPDRVLVASWESSYNAPWDLLKAGYELINASWRPLYVVGGDSRIHPGSTGGRMWPPLEIATWSKDRFMHWEPGRAVFEDRGPGDTNRSDAIWDVPEGQQRELVLGGQMSVWEQAESSLLRDLRHRLPVVAERLWSGPTSAPDDVVARVHAVDARVWGIVEPAAVELGPFLEGPATTIGRFYGGASIHTRFRARTRLSGEVRWTVAANQPSYGWIDAVRHASPDAGSTEAHVTIEGSATVRARFFGQDGEPVGAGTWARVIAWPARVQVTDYDLGLRMEHAAAVMTDGGAIDLSRVASTRVLGTHRLPTMRGPLDHARSKGQRMQATLVAPRSGRQEIAMKTQSGRATLWLDVDQSGTFEDSERLIPITPTSEERIRATVELKEGERYALRIDHLTALPRPVLIVTLGDVGAERPAGITEHLTPLVD